MHRTPAQNSQREGRSLPRQGRDHLFQWNVGISVGFFTETTGNLRNPETRRGVPRHMYANLYGDDAKLLSVKSDMRLNYSMTLLRVKKYRLCMYIVYVIL